MIESILKTVKEHLGVYADDTSFDNQIIDDINMALNILTQIGVGPASGFQIHDYEDLWEDFLGDDQRYNMVKTYVFRKTQMMFDPPSSGILVQEYNKQIDEMEWRLNALAEYTD